MQLPIWKIHTANPLEKTASEFLNSKGYEVTRTGWPDYACMKDGKVSFVEVKPYGKKLSMAQRRMKKVFNSAGLKYLVWWVKPNGEIVRSKESD